MGFLLITSTIGFLPHTHTGKSRGQVQPDANIEATFDDSVKEKMAEAGFDDIYGARPLRRAIQSKVEDALSEKLLSGEIKAGDNITCSYTDELVVTVN